MQRHIMLCNKVLRWRSGVQALRPVVSGILRRVALYAALVLVLLTLAIVQACYIWRSYHAGLQNKYQMTVGQDNRENYAVDEVLTGSPVLQHDAQFREALEQPLEKGGGKNSQTGNGGTPSLASVQPEKMAKPLEGRILTAYGWQEDPVHKDWRFFPGVVIQAGQGSRIHAAKSGVVKDMSENEQGKRLHVAHADGMVTIYRPVSDCCVQVGEHVKQGQVLGILAGEGELSLQFEIWQDNRSIDPAALWEE